ncbi:MAG TPA: DUF6119 family protein [Thermoanaerobaculia bacterium]|nr:DUF6119 family protein [Thermoanaerobaculia bacterium]
MQFNVYLFAPEAREFEEVFREGQLPPEGPYEEVPVKSPAPFEARGYLLRNKRTVPPWLSFFREHCDFRNAEEIFNQSNSFVFVLRIDQRLFVLTHGQGYLALNPSLTVPGFGLRIALNAVDPQKVRSTESRNLRETATLKQLVLSRPSSLDQFEVSFNRELLYRLEGGLGRPEIGTRIRGSASCGVATRVTFEQLGDWCRGLLKVQAEKTPPSMERADWLRRVTDPKLVEHLDRLLDDALQAPAGEAEALHLSPANIREYNQVEKYRLRNAHGDIIEIDDLDIALVLSHLDELISVDEAPTAISLIGVNAEGEEVIAQSLGSAVVFETTYEGDRYLHTPEGWVYINPSLVNWVNQQLSILASPPEDYRLPDWPEDADEGKYNSEVAVKDSLTYFCLDKKLVTVEGRSRIEVCDLITRTGDLIHVKEFTHSSQAISHLVAQAEGSSALLLNDRRYREGIHKQLTGDWKKLIHLDRTSPRDHQVVLGIGAPRARRIPDSLPFLSKQSLLRAIESLSIQGFRTFVCHIPKA